MSLPSSKFLSQFDVDAYERGLIEAALGRHRWNQRQTAPALGLTYDQLRHAMKRHGLMDRV